MRKKELYEKVITYFQQAMPVAETELHYENPFQLLIAVILSAQCTDKRVNMITPPLFRDFPTPEAPGRHGTNAGERFSWRSARHTGTTGQASRSGTQDGQCDPECCLQQSGYGCRHPRISRKSPHRTGSPDLYHSTGHRKISHQIYSRRINTDRTSLADPSRTLCLYGT